MDHFNNIDFKNGHLDDNIRRARTILDSVDDLASAVETLTYSGVSVDDAFLAVQAASLMKDYNNV